MASGFTTFKTEQRISMQIVHKILWYMANVLEILTQLPDATTHHM